MCHLHLTLPHSPYFHPYSTKSTLHHHLTILSHSINTSPLLLQTLSTPNNSAKYSLFQQTFPQFIKKLVEIHPKSHRILRTFKERSSKLQEETFFIQEPPSKLLLVCSIIYFQYYILLCIQMVTRIMHKTSLKIRTENYTDFNRP